MRCFQLLQVITIRHLSCNKGLRRKCYLSNGIHAAGAVSARHHDLDGDIGIPIWHMGAYGDM